MDFSSFRTIDLAKGPSAITVAKSGISFSQTAVNAIGRPRYVKLMIDDQEKMLAIQVVSEEDKNAIKFYKPNKKIIAVRWNFAELKNTLNTLMNWDTEIHTYRASGTYYLDDKALLFDLKKADVIK